MTMMITIIINCKTYSFSSWLYLSNSTCWFMPSALSLIFVERLISVLQHIDSQQMCNKKLRTDSTFYFNFFSTILFFSYFLRKYAKQNRSEQRKNHSCNILQNVQAMNNNPSGSLYQHSSWMINDLHPIYVVYCSIGDVGT